MENCRSETGTQLLCRLGATRHTLNLMPSIFPQGFQPSTVAEVVGDVGCGKTELINHCIQRCLLPAEWRSHPLGGLDIEVVLLDTDFSFSPIHLVSALEIQIKKSFVTSKGQKHRLPNNADIEAFINERLQGLHVIRCCSPVQMLASLHTVKKLFCNNPRLSLLLIDSISAFYWMDRMMNGESLWAVEKSYSNLASVLHTIASEHRVPVIFTRHQLMKPHSEQLDYNFLGKAFQKLIHFKVHLIKPHGSSVGRIEVLNCTDNTILQTWYSVSDTGMIFRSELQPS